MRVKKIAFNLLTIIVISITVIFYFYYLNKNKGSIKIQKGKDVEQSQDLVSNLNSGVTKFSNVEYKTTSAKGEDFITTGKFAYISKKKQNLIDLDIVHSSTKLKDQSILNIKSNKAEYNQANKNIKYYDNVIITNKTGIIKAKTANFYANKNIIKLTDVKYKDGTNIIEGDFAELNTITNNLEITMRNKIDRVYGQRKQ